MIKLGIYQHYKGNLYRVIGISRHSESLDLLVVYQALYGDYALWVRPLDLFTQTIQTTDGKEQIRFKFINDAFAHPPAIR